MIYTKTKEIPWCPKLRGSIDSIWFPVFGQVKMDGEYQLIKYEASPVPPGYIICIGKTGDIRREFPDLVQIEKLLNDYNIKNKYPLKEIKLMAELYHGEGKNHTLHDLLKDKKSDQLKLFIHDIVIQNITTRERMEILEKIMSGRLGVVLDNHLEVDLFFNDAVARGYEGVVLKPMDSTLSMANQWIKLKASDETIMQVIDLCGTDDRIALNTGHGNVTAKITLGNKKGVKLGDQMLVRHFGFIGNNGGVRCPIIIRKVA